MQNAKRNRRGGVSPPGVRVGGPNPYKNSVLRHLSLAERYRRTFKLLMLDAKSGDVLLRGSTVGTNDDTFD